MARMLGVIAEYNPFHLGHAYHLQKARELAQAEHVVVVMSSCFTQRGEAALLSPADRAKMALSCGADAVFALPSLWAVRDAEHFALGGVALLKGLGCDAISFGTETDDLPLLIAAARMLEMPGEEFSAALNTSLSQEASYPAAVSAAAEVVLPGSGALLSSPNSTLAICYLRAMIRLQTDMAVIPVQRHSGYHETDLTDAFPSATAARSAFLRGDWQRLQRALPDAAYRVLSQAACEGRVHRPEALDQALAYRLRTMTANDYASLPDLSEGIEYRLMAAASKACTRESILEAAKTRRYPHARLSRLATHALLGMDDSLFQSSPLPDAGWLLGYRRDSRNIFAHIRQFGSIPVIGKPADFDRSIPWFSTEARAYDLWALGAGLPSGLAFTQGIVVI